MYSGCSGDNCWNSNRWNASHFWIAAWNASMQINCRNGWSSSTTTMTTATTTRTTTTLEWIHYYYYIFIVQGEEYRFGNRMLVAFLTLFISFAIRCHPPKIWILSEGILWIIHSCAVEMVSTLHNTTWCTLLIQIKFIYIRRACYLTLILPIQRSKWLCCAPVSFEPLPPPPHQFRIFAWSEFIHNSCREKWVFGVYPCTRRSTSSTYNPSLTRSIYPQCERVSQSRGYNIAHERCTWTWHSNAIHVKPFPLILLAKCAIRFYNAAQSTHRHTTCDVLFFRISQQLVVVGWPVK